MTKMKLSYLFASYLLLVVFPCLICAQTNDTINADGKESLDLIAKKINEMNTTWKAITNSTMLDLFKVYRNIGFNPKDPEKPPMLRRRPDDLSSRPESFDSRNKWPKCKTIIGRIRHQGDCKSCWAVSAASVISDRICVGSNATILFHASADDILSCCSNCIPDPENICQGGYPLRALQYWEKSGVVSGGEINSNEGCKPYSMETFRSRKTMPCLERCTNPNYEKKYSDDKIYGKAAYILLDENEIMYDILLNGPVMASMDVYDDLLTYEKGVYQHKCGEKGRGHAVKLIGWGQTSENKYWLATNSWGEDWGQRGHFQILKGVNHCDIESEVLTAELLSQREREGKNGATFDGPSLLQFVYLLLFLCFII